MPSRFRFSSAPPRRRAASDETPLSAAAVSAAGGHDCGTRHSPAPRHAGQHPRHAHPEPQRQGGRLGARPRTPPPALASRLGRARQLPHARHTHGRAVVRLDHAPQSAANEVSPAPRRQRVREPVGPGDAHLRTAPRPHRLCRQRQPPQPLPPDIRVRPGHRAQQALGHELHLPQPHRPILQTGSRLQLPVQLEP